MEEGGCEERIRPTQYGFRSNRGTSDALYIARRIIDAANISSEGSLYFLLLDWSKAFDRVKSDAMMIALRRFGIPERMLTIIASIYQQRTFEIKDVLGSSNVHSQNAGIAQGCPLSPYLFIIAMTVLLHDVNEAIAPIFNRQELPSFLLVRDLLYADDTLLMNSSHEVLQEHLDVFIRVGSNSDWN